MLKTSCNRYNTGLQMALDIPLQRANTEQKGLSYLGHKIWTKISCCTRNVETNISFTHSLRKEILRNLFM